MKRQSKNSSALSNESKLVGGVKNNINRANLKNANNLNKDLISNQNTGSNGQPSTIKNVDPLYNQGSQEFDRLTQ